MSFEAAVAVLVRARTDADVSEVVAILCSMASAAHVLGQPGKRDDTVEVAAELMPARRPNTNTNRGAS